MNAKQILAGGISVAMVIAALALYHGCKKAADAPAEVAHEVSTFLQSMFQNKVTVTTKHDDISVKPIGELTFAKVHVRAIANYQSTVMSSEKVIIADEVYALKLGWDLSSDITLQVSPFSKTVTINATKPHILSCEHTDAAPTILYQSSGLLNKLTPDDMVQVQKLLDQEARTSEETKEAINTAINGFKAYFAAVFQLEGYAVKFNFDGVPSDTILQKEVPAP